ncbi:P-loop containing nucleoside triphosphate hydrolase protein [Daedalea quercina L-15889]|uniref:p-loop containing nucleoside triphosphate hydrolase protein n=1 Tax=Daedalea quercina L-15889 TaxID=1314783 RepID=A0A165U078_9APHY|nr:P-loop containing nucleoside triphosphate hydrolase protein [Daedalea quercina L-15889]
MTPYNADIKLIAVTGPTGAGKTTFINHVCGSNLKVGTGLRSCTANIDVASCTMDDQKIVLIDTPGFDDTSKSQAEVLDDIGKFLKQADERELKVSGVIYMHRISDRRVGGIARENFRLFEKICGEGAMKNVLIVTTMWEDVDERIGQAREQELATKSLFFQTAMKQGASMDRLQNNPDSAKWVVSRFLPNPYRRLQMQRELVDENKQVPETEAGGILSDILKQQQERHQREMNKLREELQRESDRAEMSRIREELRRTKEELRRVKRDEEKLQGGAGGILRFLRAGYRVEYRVLLCWKVYRILEPQ